MFDASIPLCLEPILLVAGVILIAYSVFAKKKVSIVLSAIAVLCFTGAGILLFLNLQLCKLGACFYQQGILEQLLLGEITFELGTGAIAAGTLSFIAAVIAAIKGILTALHCTNNSENGEKI